MTAIADTPGPLTLAPGQPDGASLARLRSLLQVSRPGASWWRELDARLRDLADGMAVAAAGSDGAAGWYAQIVTDAPRMQATVAQLAAEQADIVARICDIRGRLAAAPADPRWAPREITAVADLLDRVERHRRRGRAALQDTYLVDLGGE